MSALGTVLVVLAWALGLLLLALVMLPWALVAEAGLRDVTPSGSVQLRWGWRLVTVQVHPNEGLVVRLLGLAVYRRRWGSGRKDKAAAAEKKERKKKRTRYRKGLRWALQHRKALSEMLAQLVAACHPTGRLAGTVGLGDPAATAWATGLTAMLSSRCRGCELDLQWDWLDEVVDLELRAGGWLVPAHLLAIAVGWMVRGRTRRALFA